MADGNSDIQGILESIRLYFDGLYESDSGLLRTVFHPDCVIVGYGSDGELKAMSLDRFLAFVDSVPSPKAAGVAFDMSVLSADRVGRTAAVKVHDYYLGRDFIDFLHLVETPDGWRITAKAFHSEART